jgi:ubiquinol-cytochrome c reductase subunit 6
MSLSSFISDLYNSLTVSGVQAEAPPAEEAESQPKGEPTEEKEKEEELEAEEEPDKKEGEGKEEEKEEEEEEEDEPKDPAPAILEECFDIKECKPYKHHYDECVERVTSATSEGGPKEDCVEEFFHILHCANTCAAPKIWSKLK